MNFSFIICTHDPNADRVETCIDSIVNLKIPQYEILVVGGTTQKNSNDFLKYISFDETIKKGWITKKKNIGAELSKYENLVILHDYFSFDYDWYENWISFSNEHNWDIASNSIRGLNNQRIFTDWVTYDHLIHGQGLPLPYNDWTQVNKQYISGGYFLIKRSIFLENPLNEKLVSTQEEDVEWSLRIRDRYKIVCNSSSIVRHTKWHTHLNGWKKSQKKFAKVFGNFEWTK
jgi:GT2 family glycosyltransferase